MLLLLAQLVAPPLQNSPIRLPGPDAGEQRPAPRGGQQPVPVEIQEPIDGEPPAQTPDSPDQPGTEPPAVPGDFGSSAEPRVEGLTVYDASDLSTILAGCGAGEASAQRLQTCAAVLTARLVADGYLNDRVAVFDREGNFLESWGEEGSDPGEFDLPHSIATDANRVYVADRENGRVQVLTHAGEPVASWKPKATGHPYSAKPIGGGYVLVIEGRDGAGRYGAIGRLYREDGSLERIFDAGVDPRTGTSLGHDIAVARDGSVYMVDNKANRVVKFELASAGLENSE